MNELSSDMLSRYDMQMNSKGSYSKWVFAKF